MLSADEAGKRLAGLRDPRWLAKAQARTGALPAGAREVARTFLPGTATRLSYEHAARHLDAMTEDERAEVMTALHPGLGAALARWWADLPTRPYQTSRYRRAFRAPAAPELSASVRGHCLPVLIGLVGPFDEGPAWLAGR